jgi:hypothetical protein
MMYGKSSKPAAKSASKKKAMPLTIMVAVGKPKMSLPVRGERTATNMMKKTGRGK